MPDSSNSHQTAVCSEIMSNKESSGDSNKKSTSVQIDLGEVTQHNIKVLKKVNQVVFPVVYHDNFYKDVLEAGELAKLAFYNDIVVGAVCCRNDTSTSTAGEASRKLYIMTLGCLAPYRRLGIGSVMVQHVMDIVEKDGNYDSIFLHVQVNNEDAINFYKNFGFDIVETKQQYYKRIEPADAYVLEKKLKSDKDNTKQVAQVNGVNS